MGKPRILIVDSNENYIIPLQQKFIESFFDKIDLEIITDAVYFQTLLQTSQKIDILILDESLYSEELQKHDIGNLFLMTEQLVQETTGDSSVNRIFKYTSVKTIFSEIIGICSDTLRVKTETKRKTEIVLVYSAAGGTGKTTIALGLAACLEQAHKRVIYIDAEYVQNFPFFFENKTEIPSAVLSKFQFGNENLSRDIEKFVCKENFSYLPPFHASISAHNVSFGIYSTLIEQVKKSNQYDFILVDTDSSFSEEKGNLIDLADKVLIIMRQSSYSIYKTNCVLKNINYSDSEKFMFLCNAFQSEYDNALLIPESHPAFMVNEYINWIPECEKMKPDELAKVEGIQKIVYSML